MIKGQPLSWIRRDGVLATNKIYGVARPTFLVSNGNNIVACNFPRFAGNKGGQFAIRDGASFPGQRPGRFLLN